MKPRSSRKRKPWATVRPKVATEAATRTAAGSARPFHGSVTSGRRSIPGRDVQPPGRPPAGPEMHRTGRQVRIYDRSKGEETRLTGRAGGAGPGRPGSSG